VRINRYKAKYWLFLSFSAKLIFLFRLFRRRAGLVYICILSVRFFRRKKKHQFLIEEEEEESSLGFSQCVSIPFSLRERKKEKKSEEGNGEGVGKSESKKSFYRNLCRRTIALQ
jgi:hypothetical protein